MTARRLVAVALLCLPACGLAHHDIGEVRFSQRISRDLDLLFVIDRSLPTSAALGLAEGVRLFGGLIQDANHPLASVHIAFVSSAISDDGVFLSTSSCSADGSFIAYQAGQSSFTGDLAFPLTCVKTESTPGSSAQQPFAAVLRALDPAQSANKGFLREGADLLVIFMSGQDDCSLRTSPLSGSPDAGAPDSGAGSPYECARRGIICDQELPETLTETTIEPLTSCRSREDGPLINVGDITQSLQEPKSFLGQVFVLLIAGPTEPFEIKPAVSTANGEQPPTIAPSCVEPGFAALPPVRLQEFADQFSEDLRSEGASTCICSADPQRVFDSCGDKNLAARVAGAGRTMLARGRCLTSVPRFETTDGGRGQAKCTVTQLYTGASDPPSIGSCDAVSAQRPCWRVVPDHTNCVDSGFAMDVSGDPNDAPAPGTFEIDCSL